MGNTGGVGKPKTTPDAHRFLPLRARLRNYIYTPYMPTYTYGEYAAATLRMQDIHVPVSFPPLPSRPTLQARHSVISVGDSPVLVGPPLAPLSSSSKSLSSSSPCGNPAFSNGCSSREGIYNAISLKKDRERYVYMWDTITVLKYQVESKWFSQ